MRITVTLPPNFSDRTVKKMPTNTGLKREHLAGAGAVICILGLIGLLVYLAVRRTRPTYTVVRKLAEVTAGGNFAKLNYSGEPSEAFTLTRDGDRGTIGVAGENSSKGLRWIDSPTAADLLVAKWTVDSDVILKHDDGHVSGFKQKDDGVTYYDFELRISDSGEPMSLRHRGFGLGRQV